MGQQQSPQQKSPLPQSMQIPQSGYRITNLLPQVNLTSQQLNIMTDYVIDKDPRLVDLRQLYELNQREVEFVVFSILDYRVRRVKVEIRKRSVEELNVEHTNNQLQGQQKESKKQQGMPLQRQFTLGISFKYYPKINDTILRITKVFKSSPLQSLNIKKDEYIVGMLRADYTSMKEFVEMIRQLIETKVEFITLGVCDVEGRTRLANVNVKELIKWKESFGVGYLGVELAEGWVNKWELKKSIQANKKKLVNQQQNKNMAEVKSFVEKQLMIASQQKKLVDEQKITNHNLQNAQNLNKNEQETKEQVDFFNHNGKITHQEQDKKDIKEEDNQATREEQRTKDIDKPTLMNPQLSKTSLQQYQPSQQQQNPPKNRPSLTPPPSLHQQQPCSSTSEVSSQQIEQKCQQLQNFQQKKHDINVIKKTQNILEMNFKDDASTICVCKDYSKHCQKCFKEKEGNYYFFNKKTNKIITIQKAMLFPKRN